MKALLVVLCLALAGCGTSSTLRGDQQTDYVIASHAEIGGVWKMVRGGGQTCKLTAHGISGLKYKVTLTEGQCSVEASK